MCTHPFAKKALTLHLARSEGRERYFDRNLMHRRVLASFHQHLMAEAPEMDNVERRVASLRNLLLDLLHDKVEDVALNGSLNSRLPGNLSVSLPGVDAEALVVRLKHVAAFSTGAACSSAKVEPSHVLMALAKDDDRAFSSVRFGLGRGNTEEEIRMVADAVVREVEILRHMSGRLSSNQLPPPKRAV